jgi:tetratricopeptide (TPR) repeat protein
MNELSQFWKSPLVPIMSKLQRLSILKLVFVCLFVFFCAERKLQGLVLKKKAEYDAAEVLYQRAIAIILKTFDKTHYKFGQYSNNLGDCYRKRGQYDEALRIYREKPAKVFLFGVLKFLSEESLAALTGSLGAEHAETAEVQHNVAMVLHQLQRYQEAAQVKQQGKSLCFFDSFFPLQLFSKAIAVIRKQFGEGHYKLGVFSNNVRKEDVFYL